MSQTDGNAAQQTYCEARGKPCQGLRTAAPVMAGPNRTNQALARDATRIAHAQRKSWLAGSGPAMTAGEEQDGATGRL